MDPTHYTGVLGWPLDVTLSPTIHNAAFRAVALEWVYLPLRVHPDDLGAAVAGLRALGAVGANVTMPHKEAVVGLLDEVSGGARAIGAVNAIARVGDRLVGHNTDVDGFRDFLANDAGVDVAGRRALILGAGGAARAVARALDELGALHVTIASRRPERARKVASIVGGGRAGAVAWAEAPGRAAAVDLIVNATPLGARGEDALPGAAAQRGQVVVDLLYHPPSTPLVERSRRRGAEAWGGLGMLVRQAAASFQIWTGQDAPIETMSAAAVRAIGALAP